VVAFVVGSVVASASLAHAIGDNAQRAAAASLEHRAHVAGLVERGPLHLGGDDDAVGVFGEVERVRTPEARAACR